MFHSLVWKKFIYAPLIVYAENYFFFKILHTLIIIIINRLRSAAFDSFEDSIE